MTSAMILTR